MIEAAEQRGKGSFSDLATLITSVASTSQHQPTPPSTPSPSFSSSPTEQNPDIENQPPRTESPSPSFHSSPTTDPHSPTSFSSSQSPYSPHPHPQIQTSFPSSSSSSSVIELSDLYSAGDMDMPDALISDGSRGNQNISRENLPPYMPDLEANRQGVESYGKDQEFPGLR